MAHPTPPASTTILVIGGGPAGSYAATVLAREGFDVTLMERDVFPRYHIGKSMIPSCRRFMRFIGAEELIEEHGFVIKPGAALKLREKTQEGYSDFIKLDPENIVWNVIRAQFDELLLRHASASGVKVFEGFGVTEIRFSDERPLSAIYETEASEPREISFKYLVDASGKSGIMSTKYLKNRRFTKSLMNMASWGYWRGGGRYAPGTNRENAPWFEAFTDGTGWAWYIPLHDGTTSVGIVLTKASYAAKRVLARNYVDNPIAELISEVKSAGDFSYSASRYAGLGYRIAGDAGAFVDPLFSSGVHLAFTGGLSAASTIAASIRGDCTETKAAEYHNTKIGVSYTRFLITVLGAYKQIRAPKEDILTEVNENNFDRALRLLRPIIQGAADIDPRLTPQELEETLNFCKNILAPTRSQMFKDEERTPDLTMQDGSIPYHSTVSAIVDDEDAKHVIPEIAARNIIRIMHGLVHFRSEIFHGYYINLVRGELGMREV